MVDRKDYRYRQKMKRKVRCSGCTHWDYRYLKSSEKSGVLLNCFMCSAKEPHDVYTLKGYQIKGVDKE